MSDVGKKVLHGFERFAKHFAMWMLYPLILLVIGFFVLLAWFIALQSWCLYWFTPKGDEKDALYTKSSAYTVFAAFTTIAFLIVYLLLRV